MSSKRCLQYTHEGVWLGPNKPRPMLPNSITSLYTNWQSDNNRTWHIFRKYLPKYSEICFKDGKSDSDFIFKASLNGSREKAKEFSSKIMISQVLLNENITPSTIREVLPSILDKRASMALMTMPRLDEENRMKNENFVICLKRKLRLHLIDDTTHYVCKCGQSLDKFGDHCLGCKANTKTKASNGIRDGIIKVLQRILPVAKLIDSSTQVESELHNIVKSLPRLKPFDLSIRIDHSLNPASWRTHLSRIGFDVTLIHSTKPSTSTPSEAALYTETDLRLRDGEKCKFARRTGGTNKLTRRTLSADEVIGEVLQSNSAFIPIAVGPNGEFGSLFRKFLTGDNTLPLPTFPPNRPNALLAAELADNPKTPYDILGRADRQWKHDHKDKLFGGSYLAQLPSTWANQKLGLTCQTHLSNHIRASLSKIKYNNSSQRSDGRTLAEVSDGSSAGDVDVVDDDGWRFFDGDLEGERIPDDEMHGIFDIPRQNYIPGSYLDSP